MQESAEIRVATTAWVFAHAGTVFLRVLFAASAVAWNATTLSRPAVGQQLDRYFPPGQPGYGSVPGVTVLSRLRPAFEPAGIRLGGVTVNATLSSGIGYDSNATGERKPRASAVVRTDASLFARTNWGRHQIQLSAGMTDRQYIAEPRQSTTDWNAALAGMLEFGRHHLTFTYSHLASAQSPRDLSAPLVRAPAPYSIDSVQAAGTWNGGSISVTPSLEYAQWRFTNANQAGVTVPLTFQDRDVLTANLLMRHQPSAGRGILVVVRGIQSRYLRRAFGQGSRDSEGVEALAGIELASGGVWRYRLLGGWQFRQYASTASVGGGGAAAGPTVEASAIWQPTGLTTVTGTALHTLAESALLTTFNYTLTQGRMTVDHELRRNLLLQARADYGMAVYPGNAGSVSLYGAGTSATWLTNRRMRLTLSYDFSRRESGPSSYSEHILLLRLGFGL